MTEKAISPRPLLKPGFPHVAYVLLWYPLFTQPFIFREVEGLRNELPLEVYTLYGKNLRCCSDEMKMSAENARNYGIKALPAIFFEMGRQICTQPRRFWKLLRRSLFRPWKSLETFGENLWAFCAGLRLGRQFVDDGIDMAYAPWPRGSATAAWIASEIAGIPFATSARGDNLDPADPDLEDKLSAALFVRANNAADMERMARFAGVKDKISLVYNSLTLPSPQKKPEKAKGNAARILSVGRFDVTKGFDVLLKACRILKERGVDFQLTLAGGGGKVMGLGDMEKTLHKLRHDLGLENEVVMPGLVSHDQLPEILIEHDIFAAPCIIHSSGRRDGIPNTVIEAMAYGLPVAATDVNALPEVVANGKTGLIVPPGDPTALADALEWLINNPGRAREMGEEGRRLAHSLFDPQKNAHKLAGILTSQYLTQKQFREHQACAE